MIHHLLITLFIMGACADNASDNLAADSQSRGAELSADTGDTAEIPTAVAGGIYLVCGDDPNLEGFSAGCVGQNAAGEKHELADSFASNVSVRARLKNGEELELEKLTSHPRWNWAGNLDKTADAYTFSFEGFYNGQQISHKIEPSAAYKRVSCSEIAGTLAGDLCLKISKKGKSCNHACLDAGVDKLGLEKINTEDMCRSAWTRLGRKAQDISDLPSGMQRLPHTVAWGCSFKHRPNLNPFDFSAPAPSHGYYINSMAEVNPGFDLPGMERVCTCNM